MRTFVIAGTLEQARTWIWEDCDRRCTLGESVNLTDYVALDDITRLRGYSNPHGRFVGTWWERKDILELLAHLSFQSHQYNPALTKAKEIYENKRGTIQV
jgi:hypothetical protein